LLTDVEGSAGELACKCCSIQIRIPWAVRGICGQLADRDSRSDCCEVDIDARRDALLVCTIHKLRRRAGRADMSP